MKTSELIEQLQAAVAEHGDLEVSYWDGYNDRLEYAHGATVYERYVLPEGITYDDPDWDDKEVLERTLRVS